VHDVTGTVSIQGASGSEIGANAGYAFSPDTVFRSGLDGKVTLKFADGQLVALGLDSTLRVGDYRFNAADVAQSVSTLELIKGEMRVVTGLIGADNREAMRISAAQSTIIILKPGGADFTVVVDPAGQEVGVAVTTVGEIAVRTPYGLINRIAAGQFAPWQPGRVLAQPAPIATAPGIIQAVEAEMFATALPANTPVAVEFSARAAAAVAAADRAQAAANADPQNALLRTEAQTAAQQAMSATHAADIAAQGVMTVYTLLLAALAPTGAGPAPPEAAGAAPSPSPITPSVTPGGSAGGGRFCVGSPC
jgi:hypothetical protein